MKFSILAIPARLFDWLQIGLASYRLRKLPVSEREQAHRVLAASLANAKGLTMKFGQLMATGSAQDPYQPLVSTIEPLPLSEILPVLVQEYSLPVMEIFADIKPSEAAASLGQVHYAKLPDGTEVAVKIRYPGIVDTVKAELTLTDWLPSGGPFKRWQFDSNDYKQTLRQQLLKEIDYRIEAQTQQRFYQNLANVPGLCIPKIYPELTTSAVLVQSWENGCRLSEVVNWSKKQRLEIARTLLVTLFQSLFVQGEVHADPHVGNYLFRQDDNGQAVTVLLDYGCTVLVTETRRLALLKLLDAYSRNHPVDGLSCFVAMGFDAEKLHHIADKFTALCDVLFLPFQQAKAFELESWQLAKKLQELLAEQRWWFRAAGPADLLLLLRAFHGLVQQLTMLQVALPWAALLRYSVGETLLDQARKLELPKVAFFSASSNQLIIKAKKLCVRVYENGIEKINLDLPAEAALELESLIPATVLDEIRANTEVDLMTLPAKLQQEGIFPQLLFETDNGIKSCRVWLE